MVLKGNDADHRFHPASARSAPYAAKGGNAIAAEVLCASGSRAGRGRLAKRPALSYPPPRLHRSAAASASHVF